MSVSCLRSHCIEADFNDACETRYGYSNIGTSQGQAGAGHVARTEARL